MKAGLLYILVFATLLPSVSQWGVIAYYHADKDYIARVLCENRNKPELHCDGKCYLAKKLRASQDQQDKETTQSVRNLPLLQWFCHKHTAFVFVSPFWRLSAERLFAYLLPCYPAPLARYFQPPKLG